MRKNFVLTRATAFLKERGVIQSHHKTVKMMSVLRAFEVLNGERYMDIARKKKWEKLESLCRDAGILGPDEDVATSIT